HHAGHAGPPGAASPGAVRQRQHSGLRGRTPANGVLARPDHRKSRPQHSRRAERDRGLRGQPHRQYKFPRSRGPEPGASMIASRMQGLALAAGLLAVSAISQNRAFSQSKTLTQGAHRMELMLERLDGNDWHTIDPALVLNQGDRVRFRFRTSFNGYLY